MAILKFIYIEFIFFLVNNNKVNIIKKIFLYLFKFIIFI